MFNKLMKKMGAIGCILCLLLLAVLCGISWLMTCGVVYLITLCFGWTFSWVTATGVWLVLFLLGACFK